MRRIPHNSATASFRRIRLIAHHTAGEAVRLRLTGLLILIGGGFVAGAFWLREFNFGSTELKFIGDFGLGAIGGFGAVAAALVTSQLFFNDIHGRAAYCVLTRPVRRWEYVWGKLLGMAALLALFTASLGTLLVALLLWRGAQIGAPAIPVPIVLCACALQWFKLTLIAGMTLLVCSYSGSALFASCAGLILAVIAHLGIFFGESRLIVLRILPNLSVFDAEKLMAFGQPPGAVMVFGVLAYWAAYLAVFGVIASHVFRHREF